MFISMADAWRDRLAAAIEASGKSQREISLAAGVGPGYVNSIFNDGKEPSVDRLMRVCRSLNVSIYYILGGFDITPETEEFLRLLVRADPEIQKSVLTLLRQARQSGAKAVRRSA